MTDSIQANTERAHGERSMLSCYSPCDSQSAAEMRYSGLDMVGCLPWGAHFCQFYKTPQDLLDVLVPYFHQGLRDNESCMWVTSEPVQVDDARDALRSAVPDVDQRIQMGQVEIVDYRDWYTRGGRFEAKSVLNRWADKENEALGRGYQGLRVTGNTFWVEKSLWKDFSDYEAAINDAVLSHRMLVLCTYSLDRCAAFELVDVVANHEFALIKQEGRWQAIESIQQRKSREATRQSQERLELATNAAKLGVFEWDVFSGRASVWENQHMYDIFGYSRHEATFNKAQFVESVLHPQDVQRFELALVEAMLPGKRFHLVSRIRRKNDSQWRWVELAGQLDLAPDGTPRRLVGVAGDITERKQAEQAVKDAQAAAEEANRAKDHFLAVLSHELRTPLTPVLTAAQMMQTDPALDGENQELATMIRRNVELEVRLIDDLLDLTRISRGKLELHLANIDVHEKLREVIVMCQDDLAQKRQLLSVEMTASRHRLQADPARLQQVFWNLLKNAIKFTPEGGQITVQTESDGSERIAIRVGDTGIGIEPEKLLSIFEAFEQGGQATTRRYGGLGLGLAICKGLIGLHGGTIEAQSAGRGKGTTFTVTLQTLAVSEGDSPGTPASGALEAPPARHRVLLAEDHPDTAALMARILRKANCEVCIADSVASALQAVESQSFDLLISDIGLPDGSGLELMQQLRQKCPMQGIALSGFGMEDDVHRSKAAGFSAHLVKPVDIATLTETIRKLLGPAGA